MASGDVRHRFSLGRRRSAALKDHFGPHIVLYSRKNKTSCEPSTAGGRELGGSQPAPPARCISFSSSKNTTIYPHDYPKTHVPKHALFNRAAKTRTLNALELLPMSDRGDGFVNVMGNLLSARVQMSKERLLAPNDASPLLFPTL